LIAYTRINIKNSSQEEASLQFYTTIFTCVFITIGSIMFNNDTQKIVNKPITKMVEIIRNFNKPEPIDYNREENSHMKTKMLEITIYKISTLLKRGFGELGAESISEKIQIDEEEDHYIPGNRKYAIFLMVRITEFNYITDVLQEEIIVFVNKIVRILHETVKRWDGAANKNYGDKYLITWLLPKEYWFNISEMVVKLEAKAKRAEEEVFGLNIEDEPINFLEANDNSDSGEDSDSKKKKKKKKKSKKVKKEEEEKKKLEEERKQKELEQQKKKQEEENRIVINEAIQEIADKALVTGIKIIAEIGRASDLSAYASHPKLGPK
jgi:hypothetical protein